MKSEYWNTLDEISTSEKQQERQPMDEDIKVSKNNDLPVSGKIPDSVIAPKFNIKNETDHNSVSVEAETKPIEKAPEGTPLILNDNTSNGNADSEEQRVISTLADKHQNHEVEKVQADDNIVVPDNDQNSDCTISTDHNSVSVEAEPESIEKALECTPLIHNDNTSLGNSDSEEQQVINTQVQKRQLHEAEEEQVGGTIPITHNSENLDGTNTADSESISTEGVIDLMKEESEGVSVQSFKDFFSKQGFKKKDQEIFKLIELSESELEKGITYEWLNNKLSLEDSPKSNNKISEKCIKSLKGFFNKK